VGANRIAGMGWLAREVPVVAVTALAVAGTAGAGASAAALPRSAGAQPAVAGTISTVAGGVGGPAMTGSAWWRRTVAPSMASP
jgi:hypothetical protein